MGKRAPVRIMYPKKITFPIELKALIRIVKPAMKSPKPIKLTS